MHYIKRASGIRQIPEALYNAMNQSANSGVDR